MNTQHLKRIFLLILLALVLISCRLLSPTQPSEDALSESVAQTVAALGAPEAQDLQPVATPEPSVPTIDEAWAQPEGMSACQLVFVSDLEGVWDILALDFNTRQLWQLTNHGLVETQLGFQDHPSAINVSVSPDGERIAFNSDEKITHAVYVMDRDGSGLRPVGFNVPSNDTWPTWSPDGEHLSFQSDRDEGEQIYVMNIAGEEQERLTFEEDEFRYPAWSPDGVNIAMVSVGDGGLYLLDLMEMSLRRLTDAGVGVGPPDWSPDGERLVFSADLGGFWNIFVIDAATGALTQLTEGSDANTFPAWSPDGDWIAFSSDRDGQAGIYLMPAEGGEAIRLTDHVRQDLAKAWLPGCAAELSGLIAGWDRDAPLVVGDPVPVIPGPPDDPVDPDPDDPVDPGPDDPVDPVDPGLDDPIEPPQDDPIDAPQDDPADEPAEEEPTTPEVIGIPIIDVALDWARRVGQRVGLIPYEEGQQGTTIWEDLLGGLFGGDQDPVITGGGGVITPVNGITPTVEEEEPEETQEPEDHDGLDLFGPAIMRDVMIEGGVHFDATNCGGIAGTWHVILWRSELGTACGLNNDACGHAYAPVEPDVLFDVILPERSDSNPCESEFDCDWYSEPFDFSYAFVRRAYDCECDGVTQLASTEWHYFDYYNARMVIHSFTPGVIAYATIMAEEVVFNLTHSHPDVPDVVDVRLEGVETGLFPLVYDSGSRIYCDFLDIIEE